VTPVDPGLGYQRSAASQAAANRLAAAAANSLDNQFVGFF